MYKITLKTANKIPATESYDSIETVLKSVRSIVEFYGNDLESLEIIKCQEVN